MTGSAGRISGSAAGSALTLDEHHSEETLEKLNKAESARNDLEAQERLHQANSVIEFHYIVKYIKFHTFENLLQYFNCRTLEKRVSAVAISNDDLYVTFADKFVVV